MSASSRDAPSVHSRGRVPLGNWHGYRFVHRGTGCTLRFPPTLCRYFTHSSKVFQSPQMFGCSSLLFDRFKKQKQKQKPSAPHGCGSHRSFRALGTLGWKAAPAAPPPPMHSAHQSPFALQSSVCILGVFLKVSVRTMLPSQRRRLPVSTKHLPFRRGDSGILTFPSASPRGPSSLAALTGCIHLFTASFTPPATPTRCPPPPPCFNCSHVTPTPRIHSREM